jgi:glycosyltransferase involved in cell wall biosynthesis
MKVLFIKKHLDRSELDLVLRLKQHGVFIRVLTSAESPGCDQLRAEGIYIQPRPYNSKISPTFICQIRQLIDTEDFDLIHAIDSKSLSNAIFASYFRPVKIVGYRGTLAKVRRLDLSYWLALLHPRVDKIVCVNQSIYDYMREFFPAEKLSINYKGYDLEWGEEAARQEVELPPLPNDAFVVCYIANTRGRPYKGLEILVQAMHLVSEPNIHLLFIGDYEEATKKLAEQGNAAKRIHFIGVRPSAAGYLQHARIFVMPSLRDGLPRVMKEAMAQGIAVITTNIIGPTELVLDGESGLWVEPGNPQAIADAITQLYRTPELRERLGAAGKQRLAEHFSSEGFVNKTIALYRELLPEQ